MKYFAKLILLLLVQGISLFSQITVINPNGGEIWQTGKQPKILWKSQNVAKANILYSVDNGSSWTTIIADLPTTLPYYKWTIPDTVSHSCLIKIVSTENNLISDVSDSLFTIKPDDGSVIKYVVLGSSTAAGTGPKPIDSAWVWRYREYLFQKNTSTQVLNLAVGGYTTYHIMPDDFVSPSGRPQRVLGRNITTALLASPNAIIINMPSNDAANNYPVSEQVSNYNVIMAKANEKNVPVWVATPQPRNFSQSQIDIQLAMVDTTYKMFGEKAIDFWTTIANFDSRINPLYNSGDGVHLNNAGHQLLFSRVVDEKILEQIQTVSKVEQTPLVVTGFNLEQNYPNPFNPETIISWRLAVRSHVKLKIYDILGKEVATLVNEEQEVGRHTIKFSATDNNQQTANNLASGVYFYQLRSENSIQTRKMLLLR